MIVVLVCLKPLANSIMNLLDDLHPLPLLTVQLPGRYALHYHPEVLQAAQHITDAAVRAPPAVNTYDARTPQRQVER